MLNVCQLHFSVTWIKNIHLLIPACTIRSCSFLAATDTKRRPQSHVHKCGRSPAVYKPGNSKKYKPNHWQKVFISEYSGIWKRHFHCLIINLRISSFNEAGKASKKWKKHKKIEYYLYESDGRERAKRYSWNIPDHIRGKQTAFRQCASACAPESSTDAWISNRIQRIVPLLADDDLQAASWTMKTLNLTK